MGDNKDESSNKDVSDDRIHIGSTTKYANIRHIVDNHYKKYRDDKRRDQLKSYKMLMEHLNLQII